MALAHKSRMALWMSLTGMDLAPCRFTVQTNQLVNL
jgi:hypothetical protein